MNKLISFNLTVILILLVAACAPQQAAPTVEPTAVAASVTLTITGNSTLLRVFQAIQPTFEADVPTHQLEILVGDNIDAEPEYVANGTLDAVALSGTFETEVTEVVGEEMASGLEGLDFGRSALAIIVNRSQPVTDMSMEQVAGIFGGDITNWSEVGGEDAPITVFVRDAERGTTRDFLTAFMDDQDFSALTEDAQEMSDSSDLLDAVSADPNAIGYVNWAGTTPLGLSVKALNIGGISPLDAEYFVYEPLIFVYRAGDTDIQPLTEWLASDSAQAALRAADVSAISGQ